MMHQFIRPKRPTPESIADEVGKLRSVSHAARKLIVDDRCKYAGIGKYAGTIHFKPNMFNKYSRND
jgi:hypothetical protein